MFFITGFIVVGILFTVMVMILNVVLKRFFNPSYRYSFPIAHAAVIILFFYYYFPDGTYSEGMSTVLWIIPTIYDFPLPFLYTEIAYGNVLIYALSAILIGGVEFFLIGWFIDFRLSKNSKSLHPTKMRIIFFLLTFFMIGGMTYKRIQYNHLPEYIKLAPQIDKHKDNLDLLDTAMQSAFNHEEYTLTKEYAQQLVSIEVDTENDLRCYAYKRYNAHTILGLLALKNNKKNEALKHLQLSVDINLTTQQKKCFTGLNMSLAKALYQKGYKKEVLEFIKKCDSLQYKGFEYYKEIKEYLYRLKRGEDPKFNLNGLY